MTSTASGPAPTSSSGRPAIRRSGTIRSGPADHLEARPPPRRRRPLRRPDRPSRRRRRDRRAARRGVRRGVGARARLVGRRPRGRRGQARARGPALGYVRRLGRDRDDQRRRGRHREPRLGRDAVAHVHAVGRARGLRRGGRRHPARRRGRHQVRDIHGERHQRLRAAVGRAGRAPARAHQPLRRTEAAPHVVRLPRRDPDARGIGRGGHRDPARRAADRRLPLERAGWAIGEHDRLRRAHHAHPHRARGRMPERAVAAAEQGRRDADPQGTARRARATQA